MGLIPQGLTQHPAFRCLPAGFRRFLAEFRGNPRLTLRYLASRVAAAFARSSRLGEWEAIYRLMLRDMTQADALFKPAVVWMDILANFNKLFYTVGIQNFKGEYYNERFLGYGRSHMDDLFKGLLWLYVRALRERDSLGLLDRLEEPDTGGGDIHIVAGKRRTVDLCQSIEEFYSIHSELALYAPRSPRLVVGELGAGYGRLANVFLNALPNTTYVIFDLPGSLLLAQYFLSHVFADRPVLPFEKGRGAEPISRATLEKYSIVFLSPWDIPRLEPGILDVFVNIFSFQEMMPDQIENYFSLVDDKCYGLFYFKQFYRDEQIRGRMPLTLESYPVRPRWRKIFTRTCLLREDAFEALHRVPPPAC